MGRNAKRNLRTGGKEICQVRPWDCGTHCLCATVLVDAFPWDVNHDRLHRCFVPVADLLSGGGRD